MQLFETTTELQTRKSVIDIVCNKCGRSCRGSFVVENFETVELRAVWGYDSRKDGEAHEAHLCEGCYDDLVASFSILPTVDKPIVID